MLLSVGWRILTGTGLIPFSSPNSWLVLGVFGIAADLTAGTLLAFGTVLWDAWTTTGDPNLGATDIVGRTLVLIALSGSVLWREGATSRRCRSLRRRRYLPSAGNSPLFPDVLKKLLKSSFLFGFLVLFRHTNHQRYENLQTRAIAERPARALGVDQPD